MILTLAWKELREHQAIWLTMIIMTVAFGLGVVRLAAMDAHSAVMNAAFTILGMAGTYGVVCGAMMLAGEHEGGTLVFLDVFLGQRGVLWVGKFLIGVVLVLTEALAVALVLRLLKQDAPTWLMTIAGQPTDVGPIRAMGVAGPDSWFLILPIVTLEAYAWGLFGSSLTRKVLAGAAIAAPGAAFIWMFGIAMPPQAFIIVRVLAAVVVLAISASAFINQSPEDALGAPPLPPDDTLDPRRQFLDRFEALDRDERRRAERPFQDMPMDALPVEEVPILATAAATSEAATASNHTAENGRLVPRALSVARGDEEAEQAKSPREVLFWLTLQQSWGLFLVLAAVGFFVGLLVPAGGQMLWPLATLLLGVGCGVAAFGPEQRDQSYQFLSSQHLPLPTFWRFKVVFWFVVAVVIALFVAAGGFVLISGNILARRGGGGAAVDLPVGFHFGTLRDVMGSVSYFSIWLVYGFCAGQIVVWLCRKSILAILLAGLVAAGVLGLWLPSMLCLGLTGWQLWAPPLIALLATRMLVRAWASGRIKERRPMAALAGFGLAVVAWTAVNFGHRAWEMPDVGAPIDPGEFRASLPIRFAEANAGGKKIQEALALLNEPNDPWVAKLADATRLPLGIIEMPHADGHAPLLNHLPTCEVMAVKLRGMFWLRGPEPSFDHLAQILVLSRTLRHKAPVDSYVAGVQIEDIALTEVERWLANGKPNAATLKRVLDELNRHAAETPAAVDCLRTECYRAGGVLENPVVWSFSSKVPERWLARGIALSLELPWESERKSRLWRLAWAGLFRAVETPYWQLPQATGPVDADKDVTRQVMRSWLPAADGPGSSMTAERLARLLDASWLADERLYCSVTRLRSAALRSQWRVAALRQAAALTFHHQAEGKAAARLDDLVPKYLPALPVDPYSGQTFRYRISAGEHIDNIGGVLAGQSVLWSTGPDRTDHAASKHGAGLSDDDPAWTRDGLDLVTVVPPVK